MAHITRAEIYLCLEKLWVSCFRLGLDLAFAFMFAFSAFFFFTRFGVMWLLFIEQ